MLLKLLSLALSLAATHLTPSADAAPELLSVDPTQSWVGLITRKSGIFGFMGHEHAVRVPSWVVALRWDAKDPSRSHLEVFFQTAKLEIDPPDFREVLGLGAGPSAEDRVKIEGEMKGPHVLDVTHFPTLKLSTTQVTEQGLKAVLTLKDQEKPVSGTFKVTPGKNESLLFEGEIRFKLSDFGIRQPGAALGAVGVADEVEARAHLVTRPRTAVAARAQ